MENEIESFDDGKVVELDQTQGQPSVTQQDIAADPSKDTFENSVYQDKVKDTPQKEKVDKDNQTAMLEDEDGSQDTKEEGKEEKPEDSAKDEKPEDDGKEKEAQNEEASKEKPSGKTLRLKDGDKSLDISPEATVKVKVKGKNEFVTIEELKSDYSGRKAWSEEISAAKEKQENAEYQTQKLQEEKGVLIGHLEKIAQMIDDPEKNPLEAFNYLLDITGRDVQTYNKRVFDFMESQIDEMSHMDDVEKELYWTKKKMEAINSNQAAKAESLKQEEAHRELIARVDRLRESQGVSEAQYVEAHGELVKLGLDANQITPEQVVEYSIVKPFVERAESLVEPYMEELGDTEIDNLITEVSSILRKRPDISDEDALSIAARMMGYEMEDVDDHINNLNDKVSETPQASSDDGRKYKASSDPKHIESFDDYDY